MFNRQRDWQQQKRIPTRYQSTKDQFRVVDKYIQGITREDVSQFITSFPFIYQIYKKNKPNDQWNLVDQFMQAPSDSDGPGFIYGFMDQSQNNLLQSPYWIKMGRTKQNPPQKRIFQWEKDQNIELTEIFTVRSLYNKKLQKLVHSLFAYARQKRNINGKNRIQWFKFDQITLTAAAVNVLNHIMNSIHTSHSLAHPKVYLNRTLKQFTDKIIQANNHIKDIANNKPQLIAESIARDLGIQMGRNDQLKLKLNNSNSIQDILKLTNPYTLGKQLHECFGSIKTAKDLLNQYASIMNQFQAYVLHNIKQIYNKTKINLAGTSIPQIDQSKQSSTQTQQKANIPKQTTQQKDHNSRPNSKMHQQTQKKVSKRKEQKENLKKKQIQTNKHKCQQKSVQKSEQDLKQNLSQYHEKNEKIMITQRKQRKQIELYCDKQIQTKKKVLQLTTVVYKQNGEVRKQITPVTDQQINKQNKTLVKYKRGDRQKDQKYNLRPSRQKTYDTINKFIESDLNETKTQEQIERQTANISNRSSLVHELSFKISKISQLVNLLRGKQQDLPYFISSNNFSLDVALFELDFNFVIMAKKIVIPQDIQINKGKNKGFLQIFCQEINIDGKNLIIDKSCAKYVGIFKVQSAESIIAIDSYHKRKNKVDQAIKNSSKIFLNIFSEK